MSKMRVLKFGGKSLSSIEKINVLAKKVADLKSTDLVIVVSAMGQTTSDLLDLAKSANEQAATKNANRELDMLLASGERVSAALFTLALQKFGLPSQSFTGSQAGVLTHGPHSNAFIKEIKPMRIDASLEKGTVPIIAGFQGVDPLTKDVTTLGRGGSDLTACAFADYYNCSVELYKTVGSVYSCDPSSYSFAKPIAELDYNFMQALSAWGGKILHDKAADYAKAHLVPIGFYSDESFNLCTRVSQSFSGSCMAVTSLDSVLAVKVNNKEIPEALKYLNKKFSETSFNVLASAFNDDDSRFLIHMPQDKIKNFLESTKIEILDDSLSAVSILFSEQQNSGNLNKITQSLSGIKIKRLLETAKRLTFFVDSKNKMELITKLHNFID
jgi:aspartate kinase